MAGVILFVREVCTMPCYHPDVMIWRGQFYPTGGKKYEFLRKQKAKISEYDSLSLDGEAFSIPCRKCIGCRLDYSRQWADRMLLELDHTKKAIFVTLTYNNEHVPVSIFDADGFPESFSLCKRDLQLFFKRLRRHFPLKEIRYFAAGEYGKKTNRPHYHAIIYGLSLADFDDLRYLKNNELGQAYYTSPLFADLWENGYVVMSDVSYKTMAYVSRYTLKKSYGLNADERYGRANCIPEFSVMSRRPGIGNFYFDEHPDALEFTNISLYNVDEVKQIPIPKKVFERLKESNPEKYEQLKQQRKELARDRFMLELQNTDLSFIDYLEMKEESFYKRTVAVLPRNFDNESG